MHWLSFALVAYLIWSSCNLLSKILISQYVKSVVVNVVVIGIFNLLPLILILFRGLNVSRIDLAVVALTSGILYVLILLPYFRALAIEEASRVIPLWRFTPLFILLISSGLTGEHLDLYQAIAFLLLIVGGFLVATKRLSDLFHPSRAFYLMVLSSFLAAVYSSIAKLLYLQMDYYEGFTLMRMGVAISTLALLCRPVHRTEFVITLKQLSGRMKLLLMLNGLLELLGLAFYNFAMSLAPASLVSASAGIQAIFVLIFSMLLSLKFPQLLHEDISQRVLTQKGFAIVLIIVGTGMISLH